MQDPGVYTKFVPFYIYLLEFYSFFKSQLKPSFYQETFPNFLVKINFSLSLVTKFVFL